MILKKIYQIIPKRKVDRLKYYFDFLWAMTERETKARYKRAFFGFLWVILNPLLQMFVIGFIFSFFIKIPNYFLFLFSGLLPWQFFSLSLTKATPSIVFERALLQKARFPVEAIPISIILSNFIHMLISFVLFLIILIISGKLFFPEIMLIIPAFIWILLLCIGISLLVSSLNVRFRDISFFVQTLLILWFYATPILYNLQLIPKTLYFFFYLNPLTSIFELIHYSITDQSLMNKDILYSNIFISILVVFLGIIVFRKESRYFADWL